MSRLGQMYGLEVERVQHKRVVGFFHCPLLQELSVPPFKRLSSLVTVILSLFLSLLMKRNIYSTWFIPKSKPCTIACCYADEVCTDCMGMDILAHCGYLSDHRSHLIPNAVLIARTRKQLNVVTNIKCCL